MKKNYMNIVAQEVSRNGERVLRYKGSDGKFHDVAPDGGGSVLSVEEVTRTLTFGNASLQGSMQINDFLMRYGSCKITAFEVGNIHYGSSSANKIYFDNSILVHILRSLSGASLWAACPDPGCSCPTPT